MEIKVTHKYLVLPVNTLAREKRLSFYLGDECVYALNIKLDNIAPDFYAYIDLSRYMGDDLRIKVMPEMKISYRESDEMDIPMLYHEPYRPAIHFTAKNGWINDPNGLIYLDGTYHLFYQYNPCENRWNNMHWGHATSTDLIHWVEGDVALFPDESGMMYSGSAIVDENNALSLETAEHKTTLLFYTATTPFSQYLAYSCDNLKTIHKYSKTPVLPFIVKENRDPKVVFVDELGTYVMALYLEGEHYALFSSENFTEWKFLQELDIPTDDECPDLFKLKDETGEWHWVFMGAHDNYLVGQFTSEGFVPTQELHSLHRGKSSYAAQSFSGMPEGRVVRMYWQKWNNPRVDPYQLLTPNIAGQMSIPTSLALKKHNGTYYLVASPVEEIRTLFEKTLTFDSLAVKKHRKIDLECKPYFAQFKISNPNGATIRMSAFGREMVFDTKKNTASFGIYSVPLTVTSKALDITVILDRCSIELYLDGGTVLLGAVTNATYADYNLPTLEIATDREFTFDTLSLSPLQSIWE